MSKLKQKIEEEEKLMQIRERRNLDFPIVCQFSMEIKQKIVFWRRSTSKLSKKIISQFRDSVLELMDVGHQEI